METGKAFEIFVKEILISIGFSEVRSDGLYVFDGSPGQMIQGLGEAHNADVLLEPPVQTPFFYKTRLLIECKAYKKKIGLNIIRSALGLREDVNHFEVLDVNELELRKNQRRKGIRDTYDRCTYQVAVAAINGYTNQAQQFAATHRIPLIEFDKLIFWGEFKEILQKMEGYPYWNEEEKKSKIVDFAHHVGERMAVAITNSGQMLFLYRESGNETRFRDEYSLYWHSPESYWKLISGEQYFFQLPECILKQWLSNVTDELELKKSAINCKEQLLSNMIVYYSEYGCPKIKMISIDRNGLEEAKRQVFGGERI